MSRKQDLYELLKKEKAAQLGDMAKRLNVSKDFVLGLICGDANYAKQGDFVRLSLLGFDRCIVCAEYAPSNQDSVNIELPIKFLDNIKLPNHLQRNGIRGHRECYSTVDVFFRYENGLLCDACSSMWAKQVDNDTVEEYCEVLGDTGSRWSRLIRTQKMCNFYSPRDELTKRDKQLWGSIQPEISKRTKKGYERLVALIEKAYLLRN